LLSTGSSEFPTVYADMSPSGEAVYMSTAERPVRGDRDGYADLYDARVGGGIAEPPSPPAPCAGGECERSTSAAPAPSSPGSTSLSGRGNNRPKHRHCGKGKRVAHRHGKRVCVKKSKQGNAKKKRGAGSARGGSK
jgi:hypothetical protein